MFTKWWNLIGGLLGKDKEVKNRERISFYGDKSALKAK
jgi:hypothetical protein